MLTLRIRSVLWFGIGIAMSIIAVWSLTAWRADAIGPNESTFVPVAPVRIMDTRDPTNVGLAGPFVSAVAQDLQVAGSIPTTTGVQVAVPAGATGVALNVTAVSASADGFISIRPADAVGAPTTSSLNFSAGDIVPNAVEVQLPTVGVDAGKIEITYDAFGTPGPTTDILIDVVGYNTSGGLVDLDTRLAATEAQIAILSGQLSTLEAKQSRIARSIGPLNQFLNDNDILTSISITVPPGGKQLVHLTGQATITSNLNVAETCNGGTFCNIGIEIINAANSVISPDSGSFFRFVDEDFGTSISVNALATAEPGVNTYRLRAAFTFVAPGVPFAQSTLIAQTIPLDGTGQSPS